MQRMRRSDCSPCTLHVALDTSMEEGPMPVIAITGGIGSGKSTVRRIFEELGADGIDTDELARKVVEPGTEGSRQVREVFGENCFDQGGRLDRKRLALEVFNDKAARSRLESILHPLISEEEALFIRDCKRNDPAGLVVVEVPLLAEGGRYPGYDGVILVTAPEKTRLQRLERSGRYTREDVAARIKSQASESDREKLANWTVDNSGTLEETTSQVKRILNDLQSK